MSKDAHRLNNNNNNNKIPDPQRGYETQHTYLLFATAFAPATLPTAFTNAVTGAFVRAPRQCAVRAGKTTLALARAVVSARAMTRAIPRALHLEAQCT